MGARHWSNPSRKERAQIALVLNAPEFPSAPVHRCGKCVGPYGKSKIPCPNERTPVHEFGSQ